MIVGALDEPGFVVWSFEVMPESAGRGKGGADSGLRAVVAAAGAAGKSDVRVRGQFRGRNLFGDLPAESQRGRIGLGALRPGRRGVDHRQGTQGNGWSLDLDNRSESARWIEVEGEPQCPRRRRLPEGAKREPGERSRRPRGRRPPTPSPDGWRIVGWTRRRIGPSLWKNCGNSFWNELITAVVAAESQG